MILDSKLWPILTMVGKFISSGCKLWPISTMMHTIHEEVAVKFLRFIQG